MKLPFRFVALTAFAASLAAGSVSAQEVVFKDPVPVQVATFGVMFVLLGLFR